MSDTMTRPSEDIIASIQTMHSDLNKVRAVEAIMGDAAADKIKSLQDGIAAANNELSDALAAEHETARKQLVATFSDIAVAVSYPSYREGQVLAAGFTITYERLAFNMAANANLPTRSVCNGFDALPDAAFDYLCEIKPEAIPAEIMALAPGDPQAAFARYFKAKRRGYLAV